MSRLNTRRRGVLWRETTALLLGGLCLTVPARPGRAENDVLGQMDRQVTTIVAQARPSIVSIRAGRRADGEPRPRTGAADGWRWGLDMMSARVGTGFAVDRDGTIVTTTDVVGNASRVTVKLPDGRELDGQVLGADRPSRVAVVRASGAGLPPLQWAGTETPEPGQWAIVVGNPLNTEARVWVGTVTRTDVALAPGGPRVVVVPPAASPDAPFTPFVPDSLFAGPAPRLLQVNATTGPGASGAPVLDSQGRVIGMVVAASGPQLFSFASDAARPDDPTQRLQGGWEKANPDWQRRVQQLAREAQRSGERAAEHAQALSRQITQQAQRLAAEAAERQRSAREQFEKDRKRIEADPTKSAEERQRLLAERSRQMERELQPQLQELQRQIEQLLKPLQSQLQSQLNSDLAPLQGQLKALNEVLPAAAGAREIRIDVGPQIEAAMARARAAVEAAMKAATMSLPGAPPAATGPQPAPDAPASPPQGPGAPPAPAEPPPSPRPPAAPGTSPAAPAAEPAPLVPPPDGAVLTAVEAPVQPPAPDARPRPFFPALQFWSGRAPGNGGTTYAIPAADAEWVVGQIREHGRVSHPYLGVQLQALTPEERRRLNAPEDAGVRVAMVTAGSPAEAAGLRKDDLILQFQGKRVDRPEDLSALMSRAQAGDRVSLELWRDGQRRSVTVTLRERPSASWDFRGPMVALSPRPLRFGPPDLKQPHGATPLFPGFATAGRLTVSATGTGHSALVTLDARDVELQALLRELSRATGLQFAAEGQAAQQRVTLQVERVPVDDLVDSLERLYHLRGLRRREGLTLRMR